MILLDEPTVSFDLKNQLAILRLLRTIVRSHQMFVMITMYDLNTSFCYAGKFLFLKDGAIFASLDRPEISSNVIEEVYGVPVVVL